MIHLNWVIIILASTTLLHCLNVTLSSTKLATFCTNLFTHKCSLYLMHVDRKKNISCFFLIIVIYLKKLICSMFLKLHFISLKLISPTSLKVGWVCSGFSFYTIVNIHRKKQVNQTVRFELVIKQSIRCEIEWSRFVPFIEIPWKKIQAVFIL